MLRSMYAGISGMKGMQQKLDVIGNNIANVNTSGYKKGRVTFQDMMSQTVSGAEGPVNDRGGKNPSQVGLGSQLGSIDNIHTQGNRQTTNRPLDLAIEGDGMFAVADSVEAGDNIGDTYYTRSGNFYLDNQGDIVNNNGQYLLGESGSNDGGGDLSKINIPETAKSFSITSNGSVNYIDDNGDNQVAGQVRMAKFANPAGLEKAGSNMFRATNNSGDGIEDLADTEIPGTGGSGQLVSGALEMSNVDLGGEFTEMITAQRGFQANTRIITTSDEILQELVNLKR
ncbi:flagellar basal body rod protein FlgG [Pontibacillus yanchengensis]|uniref:Flagellar basal body rod protein FlgG n=2 Tax=Pontibacillus yanchengensis TaxID=462910 RepID=A0ACC7VBA2_9BACI|nr:flagellar basal body rod protein FlgG [Pontibacillus yanchengensis]MYL33148.1 flagellar basal body rod protein FlgG [Pontibacillus yanchengensis]MYL52002.1 flagellar basal body rod protein FlgG [Pontibacillus yanchengensis]